LLVCEREDSIGDLGTYVYAGELSECLDAAAEKKSSAPGKFCEKAFSGHLCAGFIDDNNVADFTKFEIEKFLIIACVVKFLEDESSFLKAVFLDKPTWVFTEEPDAAGHDKARNDLDAAISSGRHCKRKRRTAFARR
jgi:hypothetical protein